MADAVRHRQAARVILLDEAGRVLLIRFVVARSTGDFTFWATPGGELEDGEDARTAAARELFEELGLVVALTGPVHSTCGRFEYEGDLIDYSDLLFLGRCHADEPRLQAYTEAEREALREIRWWSAAELERSRETVFPTDLAAVIRRLS